MQRIANKTIWITGASSGIGEATALLLAKEKPNLILTATDEKKLTNVQNECIAQGAPCRILPYDLSDLERVDELCEQALKCFGKIDIIFHNAGISQRAQTIETNYEVDKKIFDINYFAPVKITKHILPKMIANGGGTLVVTTSISGKFGFPLRSAYSASKFALYGFFETVHAEYYNQNIRVVFICPGRVNTRISFNALQADGKKHARMDEGQRDGISSNHAAKKIVKAIKKQKPETLIGGKELMMVYIKRFCPALTRKIIRKIKET